MGERSRTHVGSSVRRLQGVAAGDAHAPEHHPARGLLLPLDLETTCRETSLENVIRKCRKKN